MMPLRYCARMIRFFFNHLTVYSMHSIGIITKKSDPRALQATRQLAEWLNQRGRLVTVTVKTAEAAGIAPEVADRRHQDAVPEGQDLVAVIGGDGTFIAAFRAIGAGNVPLLGINMGRLGFLTEISHDAMIPAMTEVLAGHYHIEQRMLFTVEVQRGGKQVLHHQVMNDLVLHQKKLARMIEFRVVVDDQFVSDSRADGLIISTPTGSTAYALSAGGPIIHPALDAMLLVPICPHALTNRPIVVPGQSTVTLLVTRDGGNQQLTLDGQIGFELADDDRILICRAPQRLRILHTPNHSYYAVLREKLHWGEQVGS